MTTQPAAAAPLLAHLEEPPLPEHIQRALEGHDPIMRERFKNIYWGMQRREAAEKAAAADPRPAPPRPDEKPKAQVIQFPTFPTETRPIVNEIARSSLFSAIQSKDRQLVENAPVSTSGDTKILFSGRQLNQDDHDVFMQLISFGSTRPAGEYVIVTGHSLLKALGRGTGKSQHDQLEAEIKRLVDGSVSIKAKRFTYFGHLIHDAKKDEESGHWVFRLNENLLPLFGVNCYTLINWEQRKQLKGDLACWLQLYLATHADPFPVKVETLHQLSGSKAKALRHFREKLRLALDALQAAGHIKAWYIDETDLVHIDRGEAITDSQQRHLTKPRSRRK